jgi:RNA polymerase sigma-70 factor (ECF subfamily)
MERFTRTEMSTLVERAKQGDLNAFESLYRANAPVVFSYLYYQVPRRQDAEAITQAVFLAAHSNLRNFAADTDFGLWLLVKAQEAINQGADSGTGHGQSGPVAGSAEAAEPRAEESGRVENLRLVRDTLARLPRNSRQVLLLSALAKSGYSAIAQVVGRTHATVLSDKWQAVQFMRQRLGRGRSIGASVKNAKGSPNSVQRPTGMTGAPGPNTPAAKRPMSSDASNGRIFQLNPDRKESR